MYSIHALASQGVWLKGIDVAKAAGWGNHDLEVRRQVDGDDKRTLRELGVNSPDGVEIYVNLPGAYALTNSSRKPQARQLARWVTDVLEPLIRQSERQREERNNLRQRSSLCQRRPFSNSC